MVTKKDKFLASAQKLLERGSLDKALAEFLKAAQEDPKDTRTWLRIAEIHVKRGENTQATQVYLKTAELYVEQGFFQRAVAVYKNVLKLTPGAHGSAFQAGRRVQAARSLLGRRAAVRPRRLRLPACRPLERGHLRDRADRGDESRPGHVAGPPGRARRASGQQQRRRPRVRPRRRAAGGAGARRRLPPRRRAAARHPARQLRARPEAGLRHLERQNPRAALAKLQACYNADAEDAETLGLLANTFEQLGQADKTMSVLKQLVKVYEDRRMMAERSQTIQRILQLDPSDPLGVVARPDRDQEERPASRGDASGAAAGKRPSPSASSTCRPP